jgi:hypothetical protein
MHLEDEKSSRDARGDVARLLPGESLSRAEFPDRFPGKDARLATSTRALHRDTAQRNLGFHGEAHMHSLSIRTPSHRSLPRFSPDSEFASLHRFTSLKHTEEFIPRRRSWAIRMRWTRAIPWSYLGLFALLVSFVAVLRAGAHGS